MKPEMMAVPQPSHFDLIRDKKVVPLVHYAREPSDEVAGVPSIYESAKTYEQRQLLDAGVAFQAVGRPYVMAPEASATTLATMRAAFDATVANPIFVADAAKRDFDHGPTPHAKLKEIVAAVASTPLSIIERIVAMRGHGGK